MRSRWTYRSAARYWRPPSVRPWRHRLATATSCARSLRHCVATAEALRSALRQLRSIAQPGSLWCGEAGRAFSAKLAEPSEAHLDEVPARYEGTLPHCRAMRHRSTRPIVIWLLRSRLPPTRSVRME